MGAGLAIDLGLRGVNVGLIERHTTPQRIPKGQNLTQRTGEHFMFWGVSEAIRRASPIPASYGNEGLVAYGSLLSDYHYDWFKRSDVREFYAADNERLPQYETERILRERATQLDGVSLKAGWTFAAAQHSEHSIDVVVTNTADQSEQRTLQARYVVACDGARSVVRDAAGITQTRDDHDTRMALLVFRSEILHELLESRFPGKTIFNAISPAYAGYWQFLGRVDLNSNWFFHAPVPLGTQRNNFDFKQLLFDAVGEEFVVEFDHIGFWDMHFAHADQYRDKRLFLAGDSAHSHPPYGGYGVNLGFEDARNLSWKLAASVQGWGSEHLLESYREERHPVFASARDDFIAQMIRTDAQFVAKYDPKKDADSFAQAWQARATQGKSAVSQFFPHYSGSSCVVPNQNADNNAPSHPSARAQHTHSAQPGFHLSPQCLDDGRSVYEHLRQIGANRGFVLIAVGQQDDTVDAFRAVATELNIPLSMILTEPTLGTDAWESNVILVRPDEYITYCQDTDYSVSVETARRVLQTALGL